MKIRRNCNRFLLYQSKQNIQDWNQHTEINNPQYNCQQNQRKINGEIISERSGIRKQPLNGFQEKVSFWVVQVKTNDTIKSLYKLPLPKFATDGRQY